jgi:ferric hydroxamate transport system permease protein
LSATVRRHGPLWMTLALGLLAAGVVTLLLAGPVMHLLAHPTDPESYDVGALTLMYSTLPRLVIAFLCGAALGASGAILQQALRNPLASPTTLGIDAGARLALALATLFVPTLFGIGRDMVSLLGSVLTTLGVFALVRHRGFSALSLVLAGLVVSLYCGALSSILILTKDHYLASLLIWGSGSLCQQSWQPSLALAWRLCLVAIPAALLLRPLSLLDLGDESVRSLGLPPARLRVFAVGIAVVLSALVTSAVGVIGFIGLVAPVLARLTGARRFGHRLLLSTAIGSLLLLLTDATLQTLAGATAEFIPTGAVTAVLGSPLILLLLPRLHAALRPPTPMAIRALTAIPLRRSLRVVIPLLAALLVAAVAVGRDPAGAWQLLPLEQWHEIMTWRMPRVVAALASGALLGVAGVVLQRLTGNEMASPEVLGVSAGSILAVALSLFVFAGIGPVSENLAAVLGGACVLAAIVWLGRGAAFAPERVLLAGIALNALIDALVGVLSATGDPRALVLLAWMAGSMSGTTTTASATIAAVAMVFIPVSLLSARWLAILSLGGSQAQALGLRLARARLSLLLLGAVLTGAATLVVGPLTFVGLMAPHIGLALGIRLPLPSLLCAALSGATIMALADWLARTVAFPLQLPTGLVAAMVGAPFLMFLLSRRSTSL